MSLACTVESAPVTSARLLDPYPTTTTWARFVTMGCRAMSAAAVAPSLTTTETVRWANPIRCTRTVAGPAGTPVNRNTPDASVEVPRLVPTSCTCAPATGCCEVESMTVPRTIPVPCAVATRTGSANTERANNNFQPILRFLISLLLEWNGGYSNNCLLGPMSIRC